MSIIHCGSVELLINGQKLRALDVNIEYEQPRQIHPWSGPIKGEATISYTFAREPGEFSIPLPSKPRWGQPGRHRRRKMRFEARRIEEENRNFFEQLGLRSLGRDLRERQQELEMAAIESMRTPPSGPLFR